MDIIYEEVPLPEVIGHFAKDFKAPDRQIEHISYFVDQHKQVIVFKLYVTKEPA